MPDPVFVFVVHPTTGAVGKVPVDALPLWIDKGYVEVDAPAQELTLFKAQILAEVQAIVDGAGVGGSGDVSGPATSTAGHLATFGDGTGQEIADSGVLLADLALLDSPAFTGNPTAPTPATSDNDTTVATTAFVKAALAALVDSSPANLDTLNELAAALGDDPAFATTVLTALGLKAPLESPAFTGNPTAPTPLTADDDTSIATTGFVKDQGYLTATGTPTGAKFLRDDQTWATPAGGGGGGASVVPIQPDQPVTDDGEGSLWYDEDAVDTGAIPATISLDGDTDAITTITIVDDGTATGGWPNRWEWEFDPVSGPTVLVQWINEYGELRGTPAKTNTVAARWFSKVAAGDTAHVGPVIEVQDDRTTRTSMWGVNGDGTSFGATPTDPTHLTTKAYVDSVAGGGGGGPTVVTQSFTMAGPVAVEAPTARFYAANDGDLVLSQASLGTTGSTTTTVLVTKNGTTAHSISLSSGEQVDTDTDVIAVTAGDYFTIEVTAAGTSANTLTVTIRIEET